MEVNNGTHTTLKTECCTYPGMYRSYLIRTVLLGKDDRLAMMFSINSVALVAYHSTSFDLIKAVRKAINSDNSLTISLTFNCRKVSSSTDTFSDARNFVGILIHSLNNFQSRNRGVHDDYVHPAIRKRRPVYGRRKITRVYGDNNDDYDYDFYIPRLMSLNNVFEQMQCFSGDMKVETPSGSKAVKDVVVGDMVLTIDESMATFSPVIMFLHKLEHEEAVFLHIHTDYGESLKLTANHLMYVANCDRGTPLRLIAAKNAQVDQCVFVTENRSKLIQRRISSIAKVTERGIYAPLTVTGDIVVNRYLVSCHSNIALKTLQQTFFGFYRSVSMVFHTHLPLGVHYMTTILDLFLPNSFL
ncbi:unnamed protein product [Angiostrongylus costaricensis]|uniref:HintN domain-containing protein n=1 Tax=Angiostrongylus costaricensis TaxID=334426 RepID=A0A158PK03_ANGCS|nr:unnamed protein product [Angiostrongylus costaricensis]